MVLQMAFIFEGILCIHLQLRFLFLKMQTAFSSNTLEPIQQATECHTLGDGVLIFTAGRTSNLSYIFLLPVILNNYAEFLLGRTQRVRVGGQLSAEVRITSDVPQGSVLGPLLFLAYVNDIWRNMESTIRIFADDCVIYRKIINNVDMEKLQKDLDRLGEWAVENVMKINESKSKAIRFTRARVKDPLNY